MPDDLDLAKADSEAAAAELAVAADQLVERLQLLGDRRAGDLAARLLVTFEHVVDAEHNLADVALEVMQGVNEKLLNVLGSTRQEAARRLLELAGHK